MKNNIRFIKPRAYSGIFILIAAIALSVFRFTNMSEKEISWDTFGYYLPLPATFIYGDPLLDDRTWVEELNADRKYTDTLYMISSTPDGGPMYFFFFGMAYFYLIFFLIGHWSAGVAGFPQDGFSLPYQYSLIAGGIIFTIIGLIFLRKILLKYFNDRTVLLILIIITLGTNYVQHMSIKNLETVNVLFMLVSIMLWNTIRWHEDFRLRHLLGIGIPIGLMALVKPSEVLIILLPLLYNTFDPELRAAKWKAIRERWPHFAITILAVVAIALPQMIYWYVKTGKILYDSYINPGVGLDFTNPHIIESLFSYRKGWLLYTPVMIFALAGFFLLHRQNRNLFRALFWPFVIAFYVLASWTEWWYGAGFSNRPVITSYPLLAVPLGFFLNWLMSRSWKLQAPIWLAIAFFIFLNQFQWWQLRNYILDPYRTTKDYYWRVFLKTLHTEEDTELLLVDRSFDGQQQFRQSHLYESRVLFDEPFGDTGHAIVPGEAFNLTYGYRFRELTKMDHAWLKFTFNFVYPDTGAMEPVIFVANMSRKGGSYGYSPADIIPSEGYGGTQTVWYLTPEIRSKKDKLVFYFWNRNSSKMRVNHLKVEVFERRGNR
jgi:hypothetical protein